MTFAHAKKAVAAAELRAVAPKRLHATKMLASGKTLAAFVAACHDHGVTATELARSWGVSRMVATRVLVGTQPLSAERIEVSPHAVRLAFARALLALAEQSEDAEPMPLGCPTRLALTMTGESGDLARAVRLAVVDGEINEREQGTITRHVGRVVAAANNVARAIRAGRGSR